MISRHIETLFCDDIRHEVGGKLSFIGVYSGGLIVPAFPVTLPKLCLSVRIVTPTGEPLSSLTLRIWKDDKILQEMVLAEDQLAAASSDATDEMIGEQQKNGVRVSVSQVLLVFSPIQFDEPCVLKVRAQTETGELAGVALRVMTQPQLIE
ncbi:hypothetical protein [uncultured Thiodictyon sp.]|jgi:hypothetical protein|uniref:DUF6941 family protein n=1 Tax=uncultured Thiodictyon sp. TaxID=1846217 RepID=UPI0025DA1AFE|nr:hypothetical protein [uncultured Thiodictyon sp.]